MDCDGANDDEYVVDKLDLRDIRVYQNKPQMFISEGAAGPQLDIYFKDMTIGLIFGCYSSSKEDIEAYNLWKDTITSILTDNSSDDGISNPTLKRFCGNCGSKIESDGLFCKYCGAKL